LAAAVWAGEPPVTVQEKLQQVMLVTDMPLQDLKSVMEFLSGWSSLRITMDWESLARAGVKPESAVTLPKPPATVEQVIRGVLASAKPTQQILIRVAGGGLLITTRPATTSSGTSSTSSVPASRPWFDS
jgi:hypothetical protein